MEETFNLTFDDYFVKQVEKHFDHTPIINESNIESKISNSRDFDYDLIFGTPDMAVDAEVKANDNCIPEVSKHSDDSTFTKDISDLNSTLNSPRLGESMLNDQVEGEHLTSTNQVEGDHPFEGKHSFEGEYRRLDKDV